MRIKDKMKLIDAVKRELFKQFNSENIGTFLGEFNLPPSNKTPNIFDFGSYVDDRMEGISNDNLMKMIEELDMNDDDILRMHKLIEYSKSLESAPRPASLLGMHGILNAGLVTPRLSNAGLGTPILSNAGLETTGLSNAGLGVPRSPTIADTLSGKSVPPPSTSLTTPPPVKPTDDSSPVKAFISHSTIDAIYANAIKENFKQYGIEAFVSGTDIKGGEKWRKKIRKEINEMKIFIAIHTQAFSESLWCQQETGLALARENDIEIIPINSNKGKAPESFLDDFQYIQRKTKNTETVVREIFETLKESEKIKDLYSVKIADKVAQKPIEQIENIYSIRSKEVTKKGLAVYKAST